MLIGLEKFYAQGPQVPTQADTIVKAHESWVQEEARSLRGHWSKVSAAAAPEEFLNSLETFGFELRETAKEAPEHPQFTLAKHPKALDLYQIRGKRDTIYCALIESVNTDGQHLIFDGVRLELCSSGSAFSQVMWSKGDDLDYTTQAFMPPRVVADAVARLRGMWNPESTPAYVTGSSAPYLLDLGCAGINHKMGATDTGDYLDSEEVEVLQPEGIDNEVVLLNTKLGAFALKFYCDTKVCIPDVEVARFYT